MTKEEFIQALNNGESVASSVWWLMKSESTDKVFGGCDDYFCCEWDFNTVEEAADFFEDNLEEWGIR